MLAQYILHDKKSFRYIEYVFYRLKRTKIVFEQYYPTNFKLCWLTFSYLKFHAISQFVQCIRDYDNTVNYDIYYCKTANKYLP